MRGARPILPAVVDVQAEFAAPLIEEEDFADVQGRDEAIETTRVHSVARLLQSGRPLLTSRPFRSPYHSISDAGLISGGVYPRPGEISLAHHGVLFLDEILEFRRYVLDGLRQPLEEGRVMVTRANASISYPARIMFVAAMNPCPCGFFGDRTRECLCTPYQIRRYRSRLSSPLLDRLDIQVEVPPVPVRDLSGHGQQEPSASIRDRVVAARACQTARYRKERINSNAQLKPRHIKKYCGSTETDMSSSSKRWLGWGSRPGRMGASFGLRGRSLIWRALTGSSRHTLLKPFSIGAWIDAAISNEGASGEVFPNLPLVVRDWCNDGAVGHHGSSGTSRSLANPGPLWDIKLAELLTVIIGGGLLAGCIALILDRIKKA